ncbi:HNH endonuclease family protein [Prauserella oleivorans]|uniref:HNH endonuclease family protein n=1 Tax=Prauserella oleivorans TaxID=1478153 RepID=A0ABW5WFT7_9PSEU
MTVPMAGTATAEPPGIPDEATARAQLAELTVAEDGSLDGYDRDLFPHWSDQGDSCNTREAVLERDGTGVETGTDCYPTSGSWYSPYDGATWTDPSDVDIDHVVPLAAAWRSGADEWTTDKREQFANDLSAPQLIAVTDDVNQEKSDQTPDEWQPPAEEYHCTYASMWIGVKHKWELTVDDAEKAALADMLETC